MRAYVCLLGVVLGVALFVPRYDLEVTSREDWGDAQFVEDDYLTLKWCRRAAKDAGALDYRCYKKTGWGWLFNNYSRYDSKHK